MKPTRPPAASVAEHYRRIGAWRDVPVGHHLARAAALWPEALAVVDGDRRLTFADIARETEAVAAGLHARGVGPGDVVSFQLPNRAEAVVLFQAIMRLGAVANPIVPIYRGRELRFILGQARTTVAVVPGEYRGVDYPELYASLRADLPDLRHVVSLDDWEELRGDPVAVPATDPDPDSVCLLLYTSGTTADPKGALHSHNTLLFENRSMVEAFGLNERDVVFNPSPVTHITGVNCALTLPFLTGGPVVLMDRWDPAEALASITAEGATYMIFSTPFLSGLVAEAEKAQVDTPSIRYIVCGGADIPDELARRAGRLGVITRMYGATEGPSVTASNRWDDVAVRTRSDGIPIAPTQVRVDERGEVLWRGPDTCLGYLDDTLNEAAFTEDGWFRTGDLARFDADGAIHIVGRIKDIVNRSGEKISTYEVENLLGEHPAVAEVAVVAGPDPRTGERGCAFVVTAPGATLTLDEVTAHLRAREVAVQKIPESLFLVDVLPRTASGKIQKFALRAWVSDRDTVPQQMAGTTVRASEER
ncbi:AMP-binding protein [Pseudonocardia sp. WMMC193]|uniref:AMP-binding protein n=1 Tax=Pseudonocardia sp. WMMC193 TaxID=2911965 RepID=UPI001F411FB0|nr:AMP-binding protein [Pseudonocardia sp. WMMC193]MCF7553474.1 AMP-binding protein [Pseudonocardia sp. WMMC193]